MNTSTSLTPSHSLQISCSTSLVPATAQKLHLEFVRLGGMRFKLKNRMLLILPQIYESGIYKKYAGSIVEYAGKYGDIAKTTVVKRLRLEENLQDKPCLKAAIEKVGVHKVALIAKIATPETDKLWTDNVKNMSKPALQSLSKELRAGNDYQQLLLTDGDSANKSQLCNAVSTTKKIELDDNSTFLFMKLKAKLGKNLTDKEFLKLILEEREKQEFPAVKSRAKNKFSKVSGASKASDEKSVTGDTSRYIHAATKRQILQQTNGKCSYPNCNSPYKIFHHTHRYSESKSHNSVIPLCKIHHEFMHNGLVKNERMSVKNWTLNLRSELTKEDVLWRRYRYGSEGGGSA